jgi:acylphosphatase
MLIYGDVQGVAFRSFVVRFVQEQGLDVSGYVKNLPDGSVEVLAQGESEALESLCVHCCEGPRCSLVTSVDLDKRKLSHLPGEKRYQGFMIKY